MGTWDASPFGNDTAADFAGDLDELALEERPSAIREALEAVTGEAASVASSEGVLAVAAAALVAAQCPGGRPVDSIYGPEERIPELPANLRALALKALDRVIGPHSELERLWDESGGAEEWRAEIARLRLALSSHPS